MSETLDAFDRKILRALQADARRSVGDVAELVGLSKSACHRRMQQLEQGGIIDRYAAILDPKALGFSLRFIVDLTLAGQNDDVLSEFETSVARIPEVIECDLVTGQTDYVLRVVAQNIEDYERVHHRIARLPGVVAVTTRLVVRNVMPQSGLPI